MRHPDARSDSLLLPNIPTNWTGVKTFLEIVRGSRFSAVREEMRVHAPRALEELETLESKLGNDARAHRLTEPLEADTDGDVQRILQIFESADFSETDAEAIAPRSAIGEGVEDRRTAARKVLVPA